MPDRHRPSTRREPGRRGPRRDPTRTSWDRVAGWYDGWVGERGSQYHRGLAIPAVLDLLQVAPDEEILDVGAGQGVLAPHIARLGARYTGIDASPTLIETARRRHGQHGRFSVGDATRIERAAGVTPGAYAGAVFMLSIQNMDPIEAIASSVAGVLAPRSRIVVLMSHPAFRQPRHSGWGFDPGRKLRYRRVDSYLTPMAVPLDPVGDRDPTITFHRPISAYVNAFAEAGFLTDALVELPDLPAEARPRRAAAAADEALAAERSDAEIPMFLGLRAVR